MRVTEESVDRPGIGKLRSIAGAPVLELEDLRGATRAQHRSFALVRTNGAHQPRTT